MKYTVVFIGGYELTSSIPQRINHTKMTIEASHIEEFGEDHFVFYNEGDIVFIIAKEKVSYISVDMASSVGQGS